MLPLPNESIAVLLAFAPLFSRPVFRYAQVLLVGAILTPGQHTVANVLRVMGLQDTPRFQNYHRVLNRAKWNSRKAAQILLGLLVELFAPIGVLVLGIDETLERRRGEKIAAKGIYRDAVRSSKEFFVKSSGLRWISLMLLAPIPWAGRVWALPFLSALAPSERYHQQRGKRHKTITHWAGQMVAQVRRWLPQRLLVLVADSSYAVLELLHRCNQFKNPVVMVTRLRLDARLYEPAPPRRDKQMGRPPKKGKRLPTLQAVLDDEATLWQTVSMARWYSQRRRAVQICSGTGVWYHAGLPVVPLRWVLIRDPDKKFKPQALLCTDLCCDPAQIIAWFVQRWQLETTFEEVRRHLGVETQRQWNEMAILRTTPVLLGLFSIVALLAHQQAQTGGLFVRRAAWYVKEQPTFSDVIASVRRSLWRCSVFSTCWAKTDVQKLQQALLERFADTLCYAA
jgi:DDE superfamily endonuclease